jgi:hypothetical protein
MTTKSRAIISTLLIRSTRQTPASQKRLRLISMPSLEPAFGKPHSLCVMDTIVKNLSFIKVKEPLTQELIETVSNNFPNPNQEAEIQYIELKGKKGTVTLHTGKAMDSVQILVGKADELSLNIYGSSTHQVGLTK